MLFAFGLSSYSIKTVFLGATPQINQKYIAKIMQIPGNLAKESTRKQIAKISGSMPLPQIAPGVYAGEHNNIASFRYKLDEIEWVKVTVISNSGKTLTINYPKGSEPDSSEIEYLKSQ